MTEINLNFCEMFVSTGKNLESENPISFANDEIFYIDHNTSQSLQSPNGEQIDLAIINEYDHLFTIVFVFSFIDKFSVCSFFVSLQ